MNYTIKNLTNKNDVKKMVENGIILSDDEVKSMVKEHNKNAGFFGKKSERGILMAYKGNLKIIEKENKRVETKSFKEIYNEVKAEQEEKDRIKALENQRKAELKALENQRKEEEKQRKAIEKQRKAIEKEKQKEEKRKLKALEKQRKEEEKRLKEEEKRKAEEMKQINEFCKLAGITVDEYNELSVFERAQLNLQMKQVKEMNQTKKSVALMGLADGWDRMF